MRSCPAYVAMRARVEWNTTLHVCTRSSVFALAGLILRYDSIMLHNTNASTCAALLACLATVGTLLLGGIISSHQADLVDSLVGSWICVCTQLCWQRTRSVAATVQYHVQ